MPHWFDPDEVETHTIIGIDGDVDPACTWSHLGVGWPFPFCTQPTLRCKAPPDFFGKHALRARCTVDTLGDCAEWLSESTGSGYCIPENEPPALGEGQIFWDDEEYPDTCTGGYAWFQPDGPCSVSVKGGGSAGVRVLRLLDKDRPSIVTYQWSMRWVCGTYKDVVRGKCITGGYCGDPVEHFPGICAGSNTPCRVLGTGFSITNGGFDCDCNAYAPLGGNCDLKEVVDNILGDCGWTPSYLWPRHFAQAPLKGNNNHPLANDAFEIVGDHISEVGSGCACNEMWSDHPGGNLGCAYFVLWCSEPDPVWVSHDNQIACDLCETCQGECVDASDWGDGADLCDTCMFQLGMGNRTEEGTPADYPDPGSQCHCTAWSCVENLVAGEGTQFGDSSLDDPIIIPAGPCGIILMAHATSPSGRCEYTWYGENGSLYGDTVNQPAGCPPSCDPPGPFTPPRDAPNLPGSCGTATVSVQVGSI